MNEDRELLELAAKAAGLKHVNYDGLGYDGSLGLQLIDGIGRHTKSWDPLEDDGDALRLAVKLGLLIDTAYQQGSGASSDRAGNAPPEFWSAHQSDANAATRRTIVRAAAEIGKAMP